jgi:hypothetical protein
MNSPQNAGTTSESTPHAKDYKILDITNFTNETFSSTVYQAQHTGLFTNIFKNNGVRIQKDPKNNSLQSH